MTLRECCFGALLALLLQLPGNPAIAATLFDIRFFDSTDRLVGSGSFQTDPSSSVCAIVRPPQNGPCGDSSDPAQQFVMRNNPVTDFTALIQGQRWDYENQGAWWTTDGQSPGYQGVHRGGPFVEDNRWFFGDPYLGLRQLYMNFATANAASGSGDWGQQLGYDADRNALPAWIYGNGRFEIALATVPLPASFVSLASILLVIPLMLRQRVRPNAIG